MISIPIVFQLLWMIFIICQKGCLHPLGFASEDKSIGPDSLLALLGSIPKRVNTTLLTCNKNQPTEIQKEKIY